MITSHSRGRGIDAWVGVGDLESGATASGGGAATMGFLSRAGRLGSPGAGAGAASNTPVAYSGPEYYKTRPNFAPFGSTAS